MTEQKWYVRQDGKGWKAVPEKGFTRFFEEDRYDDAVKYASTGDKSIQGRPPMTGYIANGSTRSRRG